MAETNEALILDLVEWIAVQPRNYEDVMPRLTIREDAVDRKLMAREHRRGIGTVVRITPSGRNLLTASGRSPN